MSKFIKKNLIFINICSLIFILAYVLKNFAVKLVIIITIFCKYFPVITKYTIFKKLVFKTFFKIQCDVSKVCTTFFNIKVSIFLEISSDISS